MAGKHRRGAPDRPGDLKDFAIKHDSRILARRNRPEDVRAHRPVRGRKLYVFVVEDDHGRVPLYYLSSTFRRVPYEVRMLLTAPSVQLVDSIAKILSLIERST